jgi:hypothetical protein
MLWSILILQNCRIAQSSMPRTSASMFVRHPPIWIICHVGVVQNYGTPKLPLRRPFANLSRPSRIGTGNYDHVFVCIFRNKGLQEDCIKTRKWKHLPKAFYRVPDNGHTSWKDFEGFLMVFAVATLQDKLDHFGPSWDPGRLAFRQPSANLSRISRL